MRSFAVAVVLALLAARADAQEIYVGDDWEGFPYVEYLGGDARHKHKGIGILVLTDTAIAFYNCASELCRGRKGRNFDPHKGLLWVLPLRSIKDVSSSSQNKGPSATGRMLFGALATDRNEEYFGFSYETETSAEAPVFKVPKTFSGALEAKVRFRLKRLGVQLPL